MPHHHSDKIDFDKVVTEAENGNGLCLLHAMDGKSLQAQLAAVREINTVNADHIANGLTTSKISAWAGTTHFKDADNNVEIMVEQVNQGDTPNVRLFTETFKPAESAIHYEATDVSNGQHQDKVKDETF